MPSWTYLFFAAVLLNSTVGYFAGHPEIVTASLILLAASRLRATWRLVCGVRSNGQRQRPDGTRGYDRRAAPAAGRSLSAARGVAEMTLRR
jgi:hypothetical protein